MKKKRLQKMISLAVCAAMTMATGGFPVAAEEVYEVAADEEAGTDVQEVQAESEIEDSFQDVGEDEELLFQEIQEGNEDVDVLFGDGTAEEFSSGEATTDLQYGNLSKVYLDPAGGSDDKSGESSEQAVKTIDKVFSLLGENGIIYLKNSLTLNDDQAHVWSGFTIRPTDDFKDGSTSGSFMIQVSKGTSLTLENVKISNIRETGGSWSGENLIVKKGEGELTIEEGTVLECDAKVLHAIYTNRESGTNATVRINGGEIKGADRTEYEEKTALVTAWYGTVEMNDGTISGNTSYYGGGIYLYGAQFTMNGGRITGNTARRGGGIYAEVGATVTLSGGMIDNNQAGDGGGIYAWSSDFKMDRTDPDGQPCVIENNTATADHNNWVYGQGGGVFLGNGKSSILGKGTIQGNKAIEEVEYNEEYDYTVTYGGQGGGVYAWNCGVDMTAALIRNNQTGAGGGIFAESIDVQQALNMTGGEITGNTALHKGAGIGTSLYYPDGYYDDKDQIIPHTDMDLRISGGKISGNMTGEGEYQDENAVALELTCWSDYDENVKFPKLYLSGSPEIKGNVTLLDDAYGSPKVVVDGAFTPVNPVEILGRYCEQDSVAVEWQAGLTPNAADFTVDKGFTAELRLDGQNLKWVNKVRVTFFWRANPGDQRNSSKNLYIVPGNKVDPSDIPVPAEVPGYTFTGWATSDGQAWTPDMEITGLTFVYEQRALKAPSVTLSADMEGSCFMAPVTLTAKASHELSTAVLTYQWYKDGTLLENQTEAECKVFEPGEYKVVVTAKRNSYTSTKDAVITISKKDHEYTWKSDAKTHWQVCAVAGESTDAKPHEFGEWKVVKEAAVSVPGEKEHTCAVCGYKETEAIAALPAPTPTVVPPTPTAAPTQAPVHLNSLTSKKTSVTIKWNKVKGASGYKIYGSKCGNDYRLLKTVKGSTVKWTHKGLKENTYYKYYVVAYKTVNGKQTVLSKTPTMHIPTTGGKFSKVKSINIKKQSFTLKTGKKATIKASVVNTDGKIAKHVAEVRYMSSNKKVATVNSKGVITAKGKGKCTIYCYAQNGLRKSVKVTVK
nr:Ig-like domain-containing protein [uncultured Blautia sp.]